MFRTRPPRSGRLPKQRIGRIPIFFIYRLVQITVCNLQVIFADIRNGRQRQHKSGDPDATKNRPVMLTRAFTVCMYVFIRDEFTLEVPIGITV